MWKCFEKLIELFEDDTGHVSSARCLGSALVLAYIYWSTIIVWADKAIPDMPIQLVGMVVSLYAINKISSKYAEVNKR